MAVTARPEISKILLDLGIEPVDVYAVDNAEQTYLAALREGISTIEVASKDKAGDERSKILRDEVKRIREKKRKINVNKLFARKQVIPTNKIKPQALLPGSADEEKKGGMDEKAHSILDSIIGILRMGNKQDKKEADTEKKEREKKRRNIKENLLESTKGIAKVGKNLVGKIVSPFSNILNAIGNFLKFVLAGVLFNVIFKWFTDPENQEKITTLTRFFKDWWPALTFAALAFLTPLGTIIGGLIGFLSWALPALVALSKNPILIGAGIFSLGGILPEIFPGLVQDEADRAVDESVEQQGEEATIDQLEQQQQDRNIFQRIGDFVTGAGTVREEQVERLETGEERRYGREGIMGGIMEGALGPVGRIFFNKGGKVPGSGNTDTVPAMLTPGEFVMRKDAVKKYGVDTLTGMNAAASATPNTINNSSNNTTTNRNNNSNISTNSIINRINNSSSNNITNTIGAYKKGGLVQNFNEGGLVSNLSNSTSNFMSNITGGDLVSNLSNSTSNFMSNITGGDLVSNLSNSISNFIPNITGGGLIGNLKEMIKDVDNPPKSINLSQGNNDFIPAKTIGLVAVDVPVNTVTDKTIVLPEKRIVKEDQTPMKVGSKTIPDISIFNRSPYRAMITRSLGINDLVGV
tara:strand:+ start:824 stop:2731 length:1908 start_codon:yes stop_codon:yes gene_type:complete